MSFNDIAISVTNVSKCYQIYDSPRDRLKQFVVPRLLKFAGKPPKQYFRAFWALKDVSFELKKGETVGIIGRNGSGKSTLLQIICGTLSPTAGNIIINGRVAALLELGSGFNPEFTGRDNIYLNATLLGLKRQEVDSRLEDIIAFADIYQFIDQPVKTYSSGMVVRLAFAVIAHVDADILVIDEALAVGDVFFQQKCMRFLRNFQANLGTVLFVSHDMGALVGLCSKATLLDSGSVLYNGQPEDVSKLYLEKLYADPARRENFISNHVDPGWVSLDKATTEVGAPPRVNVFNGDMHPETHYVISSFRSSAGRFGDEGAVITDAGFLDNNDKSCYAISGGEFVTFFIKIVVHKEIHWPAFGFMLKNSLGEYIFTEGTDLHFRKHELIFRSGDIVAAHFSFKMPHLNKGRYLMNVAFAEGLGDEHVQHCWIHDAIQVDVVDSRLAHGYCGMNEIAMSIRVDSHGD